MKRNSEALSEEYLHVNYCGCEHLGSTDIGSIRPDGRIDYHILYIAKGECFVTENEKEIAVPAGSVIVYLPRERQEYKFYEGTESISYFIHFTGTACGELMERFGLSQGRVFHIGQSSRIENAFNQLIDEFRLKLPFFEYSCRGVLMVILSLISRKMSYISDGQRLRSKKQIEEICRYMHANYSENINVAKYAKMCNLSESRFSHLFKEQTGLSPVQYLIGVKIGRAKELIENTDLSILQISEALGMQSQNYFSRLFKKCTGSSPLRYRSMKAR